MKTIAWNVDTQYDFMSPVGKLPIKGATEIESNLEKITNYFRNKGTTIVNTGDWHTPEAEEISDKPDYVNTFPPHCIIGTSGAEYIAETKPINPVVVDWRSEKLDLEKLLKNKEIVVYKDKFDVFLGSPYTDKILKTLAPERVVVYGVATDYCVNYAVLGLLERGLEVYVVEDALKEIASAAPVIDKWKELGKGRLKLIKTEDLYK
jgi:nicotinamidase/pyrazinamidase